MGTDKALKGAEAVFLALLVIGLMGLLFLIIFGNLSNNLGWTQASTSYSNETINLTGANGVTPTGASGRTEGSISSSSVIMNNASSGASIGSGNYTLSGVLFNATPLSLYVDENVNVSYTVSYNRDAEINTENTISNLTTGATTFFTFSNVWFVLTAITILIAIVLGVIALVRRTSSGGFGDKKSRSEFMT